jgi:hypothetical protein
MRVPLLVVFLPLGSGWIRGRNGRRVQGVEKTKPIHRAKASGEECVR